MSIEVRKHHHKNGAQSTYYRAVVRQHGRKITKTFRRKLDAEQWELRQKAKVLDGKDIARENAKFPLREAIDRWFVEHVDSMTSLGYARRVRQHFDKHISPWFGNCDIKRISSEGIFTFRDTLIRQGLTKNTVNTVLASLRSMFNHHVEEERILRNPVRRKHYFKEQQKDEYVWTRSECERFLEHAREKYRFRRRHLYIVYKIAANTGMRWGEIMVLELGDLDCENKRIKVSKSWCRDTKGTKRPKNGKIRYAPMSDALASEINDYIQFCRVGNKLFVDAKGRYLTHDSFHKFYKKDTKAAGVPYTKFHNLRRFFVTQYLEAGGSEAVLRQIVGHGHMQMTDHYHQLGSDFSRISQVVNI